MKKLLLNVLVFSLLSLNSFAQTVERANSIGLLGGVSQYNGDLGQGFYGSGQATYAHIGISYSRYITSKADFSTNAITIPAKKEGLKRAIQPYPFHEQHDFCRVEL